MEIHRGSPRWTMPIIATKQGIGFSLILGIEVEKW
jgi:hypothetical protein